MQDEVCRGYKRRPQQVLNIAPDLPGPKVLDALRNAAEGHQVLHFKDLTGMQMPFPDLHSQDRCVCPVASCMS